MRRSKSDISRCAPQLQGRSPQCGTQRLWPSWPWILNSAVCALGARRHGKACDHAGVDGPESLHKAGPGPSTSSSVHVSLAGGTGSRPYPGHAHRRRHDPPNIPRSRLRAPPWETPMDLKESPTPTSPPTPATRSSCPTALSAGRQAGPTCRT